MIHHVPGEPKATYPQATPIRGNLGSRPLVVETYSRVGLRGRRYYWRVKHKSNGEPMGDGEPYSAAKDRDHAVDVLWPDLKVNPLD